MARDWCLLAAQRAGDPLVAHACPIRGARIGPPDTAHTPAGPLVGVGVARASPLGSARHSLCRGAGSRDEHRCAGGALRPADCQVARRCGARAHPGQQQEQSGPTAAGAALSHCPAHTGSAVSAVEWLGTCDYTAATLLGQGGESATGDMGAGAGRTSAVDEAAAWLRAQLAAGPRPAAELLAEPRV